MGGENDRRTCPNCAAQNGVARDVCSNCGTVLTGQERAWTRGAASAFGIAAGVILGVLYSFFWGGSVFMLGLIFGGDRDASTTNAEICRNQILILGSQALLLLVFGVAALPVTRRALFRIRARTAADEFIGTLAVTMFVPFLPCGTWFSSMAFGKGGC